MAAWTEAEEAQLWTLAREGLSREEIAKRLGRSVGSVEMKAFKLGIKFPRQRNGRRRSRRREPNLTPRFRNTFRGFSLVSILGCLELEWRVEWLAQRVKYGRIVHDGRVRTIPDAVADVMLDLHLDARRARTGEVA